MFSMENHLDLIRRLQIEDAALKEQIEMLKDEVKAHMTAHGVEKLNAGRYSVSWKPCTVSRFDTHKFKADHEDLYVEYSKPQEVRQFVMN